MNDLFILLIILLIWLVIYLVLEINIINKKRKIVSILFNELDNMFIKRLNILNKIIDIVKAYDKNQFDEFGSKLYDYINNYKNYDSNNKLKINEEIVIEIRKLLMVSDVYPELNNNERFVKFKKQLMRYDKIINKLRIKYNRALKIYNSRKKIFPSAIICCVLKFYPYNYFNLND